MAEKLKLEEEVAKKAEKAKQAKEMEKKENVKVKKEDEVLTEIDKLKNEL